MTPQVIERNTEIRNRRVKAQITYGENLKTDPRKEQRIARHECVLCFYACTIAGQGFTSYTCHNCMRELQHHNTAIPNLCPDCATEFDLCCKCGAELTVKC